MSENTNGMPRNHYRRRFGIVLTLCIILALGSFWLMQIMQRNGDSGSARQIREGNDYYADNFSYTQMNPQGLPNYRLTGTRLTHRPLDDSFDIVQPRVINLDSTKPGMTAEADHGHIQDNNTKVILTGNARAVREKTATQQAFTLTSQQLELYPNADVITSGVPTTMVLGSSTLTGNSMYMNNATRELRMNGDVMTHYVATPGAASPAK